MTSQSPIDWNAAQDAYRQALEAIAPKEIAAARANNTYQVTWSSKKPNKTDMELRAHILDMLAPRPLTTMQIRARVGISKQRMYALLAKLEDENLLKSKRVVVNGLSQSQWRLL